MKKRNLLTLLSLVLALSLGICGFAVFASAEEEPAPVDFALDSGKWQSSTNAVFDAENGNMYATAKSYAFVTKTIGGNSTVDVTAVANLAEADNSWNYSWIMVKSDGTQTGWNPGSGSSTGNFIAVAVGKSIGSLLVYECKDGVVTADNEWKNFSNNFVWKDFAGTMRYVITTTDTDDGVTVDFRVVGSDNSVVEGSADYSWTYKSVNKALWGEQKVIVGRIGDGANFSENLTYRYNVLVTDRASAYDPSMADDYVNYAAASTYWSTLDNVVIDENEMYQTNVAARAVTAEFGANAKVKLDLDYTAEGNGPWGGFVVMIKGKIDDYASTSWSYSDAEGAVANSAKGSWVAAYFTHATCGVYVCKDGVATKASGAFAGIDGNSFWHIYAQKNTFFITTEDNEKGSSVYIAFTPSGHAGNTGSTYTYSAEIEDEHLWGVQSLAVVGMTGARTFAKGDNSYSVQVEAEDSDYERDDGSIKFASDAKYWDSLTSVAIDENGMYQTAGSASAYSVAFGGNAEITAVMDLSAVEGGWGGIVLLVKGSAADYAATSWTWNTGSYSEIASAQGSFVAFYVGNGKVGVYEVNDGVVTENSAFAAGISGYDFWYVHDQTNTFTVTTKDVADGCEITISFLPSGHSNNTGKAYTYSAKLGRNFWGEQSIGLMSPLGAGASYGSANNSYKVNVFESASSYTKDMAPAADVADMINAISYETIDSTNYTAVKTAVEGARAAYEELSETQQAYVAQETLEKLAGAEKDLSEVDVTVLAQYAINNLPTEAFDATNFEVNSAIVKDAYAKYESLTDEQKATLTGVQTLLDKKAELDAFEGDYNKAKEVDSLIAAIPESITNYGKQRFSVYDARAAYDALTDGQKALVANYAALTAAEETLAEIEAEIYGSDYNFAAAEENYAHIGVEGKMKYSEGGTEINVAGNAQSFVVGRKVGDGETITYVIDARLADAGWGNFYFVFKHDEAVTCHSGGSWLQHGNYAVLLMGADGFKVTECVDGKIDMTEDALGNPIAAWRTVLDGPSSAEGGTNFDVWYVYKQFTVLSITTEDIIDEEDGFIGWKATFTLTGGDSGATITRTFTSRNTAVQGAGYSGIEFFTGANINEGAGGVAIKSITISGVSEYDAKAEAVKNINDGIAALPEEITDENYASAKAAIAGIKAAYEALPEEYRETVVDYQAVAALEAKISAYEDAASAKEVSDEIAALGEVTKSAQGYTDGLAAYNDVYDDYAALGESAKALVTNYETLEAYKASLDALKADLDAATAADRLIAAIISDIDAGNYEAAKSAYDAAKSAYDALTDEQKGYLAENAEAIATAKAAIEAYEGSQTSESASEGSGEGNTEEKKGCVGSVGATAALAFLALIGVAVAAKKKD